jgi:ELWxxDGT repeat protein
MKKILFLALLLPLFANAQISVVKNFPIAPGVKNLMRYNNQMIFFLNTYNDQFVEMWKTDGTTAGTVLVKDGIFGIRQDQSNPVVSGGLLYFSDNVSNLWRTDGTTAGTFQLTSGLAYVYDKVDFNGIMIFIGRDDDGNELWRSDGTVAGTYKIVDFATGSPSGVNGAINLIKQGNYVYFAGNNNGSLLYTLCRTNGTAAGTEVLNGAGIVSGLTEFNGKLIYNGRFDQTYTCTIPPSTYTEEYSKIMQVENGVISTLKLPETYIPSSGCTPIFATTFQSSTGFRKAGNYLYFEAKNITNYSLSHYRNSLWRTDGTTSGTILLKTFNNGYDGFNTINATTVGLDPFFLSNSNQLKDVFFDNILLFPAGDATTGWEVWRSDGTATGTYLLKDINLDAESSTALDFRTVNGNTYFSASNGSTNRKLYQSDGTTAGTVLVADPNSVLNYPLSRNSFNTSGNQQNLWSNVIGNKFLFVGTPTTGSGFSLFMTSPPPCETTVTLQSTTDDYSNTSSAPNGVLVKQAFATNGSITATNKITSTAKVTYQAKSISLNNGFKADNGTVFKAEIGGCSN